MKILMVCLGNICRSPLGEGIMRSKSVQNKLNFEIDSAGTAAYHIGKLPDKRSTSTAKKYGIDLTEQRARKFSPNDFKEFDVIFAMDQSNYQNILKLASNEDEKLKVRLILNESHPNQNLEVPDPYYGENDGFENVFSLLEEACETFIQKYAL